MTVNDKVIHHAILNRLKNDEALSKYVKSFTLGATDTSRKIFPYINVESPAVRNEPHTIGRNGKDVRIYRFEITCGTKSLVAERAYSGTQGMLQLCEDLVSVIWPSNFDGAFYLPVRIKGVETSYSSASGGSLWKGRIVFEGRKVVQRSC